MFYGARRLPFAIDVCVTGFFCTNRGSAASRIADHGEMLHSRMKMVLFWFGFLYPKCLLPPPPTFHGRLLLPYAMAEKECGKRSVCGYTMHSVWGSVSDTQEVVRSAENEQAISAQSADIYSCT